MRKSDQLRVPLKQMTLIWWQNFISPLRLRAISTCDVLSLRPGRRGQG